ncbi:MAG: cation:proton antiporter [Candidatus Dechloromonas phosphoritropha]|jgi:Kef-type K+ transport system membrane component KefB|nr:cation:proton antiporter [Candidatus Dechloromonas phosphoritropha]MBP8786209.1 cation:proton antiporter [Azonexus sp.]MBP9226611.1 cation:proton antiporter [Azonexus sp.]
MKPSVFFLPDWPLAFGPLLWVALAVFGAALAGEWVRHHLGLPRITAYPIVGMVVSALAGAPLVAAHSEWLHRGLDVALAILLFELGSRVDLRWLRNNRWLLVTSLCESLAAFGAVFLVSRHLGLAAEPAALLAAIGMATSPAVIMRVVAESNAQGQVSTRLLILTALNTIYAVVTVHLALGVLHQRYRDDWVLAITHPLYLLGGGLLVGMLLAEAVSRLDRWLRLRDEYASTVLLGLVLMTIGLIEALHLPVTLCMLFAGIVLRNSTPRAWVFPRHFGSVGGVLVVMLFLVVGAQIKIEHLLTGGVLALVLIGARSLAKLCGILLLARPAGISWRQGLLLGLALSPAAGPVMVAAADIGRIYPQLQGTMVPVAMSAAAIMELAGPVIVALCLKWSGERRD